MEHFCTPQTKAATWICTADLTFNAQDQRVLRQRQTASADFVSNSANRPAKLGSPSLEILPWYIFARLELYV